MKTFIILILLGMILLVGCTNRIISTNTIAKSGETGFHEYLNTSRYNAVHEYMNESDFTEIDEYVIDGKFFVYGDSIE